MKENFFLLAFSYFKISFACLSDVSSPLFFWQCFHESITTWLYSSLIKTSIQWTVAKDMKYSLSLSWNSYFSAHMLIYASFQFRHKHGQLTLLNYKACANVTFLTLGRRGGAGILSFTLPTIFKAPKLDDSWQVIGHKELISKLNKISKVLIIYSLTKSFSFISILRH